MTPDQNQILSMVRFGPRPRRIAISRDMRDKYQSVVVLLKDEEDPHSLFTIYQNNGITVFHYPLSSRKNSCSSAQNYYTAANVVWKNAKMGSRTYVHCAAGKDRSGLVCYTLCRLLGMKRWNAIAYMGQHRPVMREAIEENIWRAQMIDHWLDTKGKQA